MDFGLTIAMRFYLWPFWHQFSLMIYLIATIAFMIAAIIKANAQRRRRKVFEKLELSMLSERSSSTKAMSAEDMLKYDESLQNQLAAQGLKLERKPVISRLVIWQAITIMIIMNVLNIVFGFIVGISELKQELGPEQKRAAQQQYGVEFDEDTDIEIPMIRLLGKLWASSYIQNTWVFDIIFVLIVMVTAASEKEYWREAWRLIKLRKIGIISFYIFMVYISIAILDSITWRNVQVNDAGNVKLKETGKVEEVRDANGKVVKPESEVDIEKLPKYQQEMVGDPILEGERRSLLDRIFRCWSHSDNDEQGYSAPFSRYTLNKTKLNDFRNHMYFDVPIDSGDITFELRSFETNGNIDTDLFYRWEEPVLINHTYKPIDNKFVKPPWEDEEASAEYFKPKNDDVDLSRWWTDNYQDSLVCDHKEDSPQNFTSMVLKKEDIAKYIEESDYIERYLDALYDKIEAKDDDQLMEEFEKQLADGSANPKYIRIYICLVAWNKTTGQPAILSDKELKDKKEYGLTNATMSGDFIVSFKGKSINLVKTERDKTGSVHLLPSRAEKVSFPNVIRAKRPLKSYHFLGTSKVGKDTLYESMKGIRTGIIIGVVTTLIAIPFALLFGLVAGYFGGWVDDVIVYFYSVLGNIPSILLIAAFVMLFDRGLFQLCLIMGITSWVGLCRLLRGETYKLREMEYVQAAEAFGVPKYKIILRHLMPNVLHIVMISAILRFSGLVMSEVMLTYLQIGVNKGSWGKMIVISRQELARDPAVWWPMAAAFLLMLVLILSANLFGDAVQDALDPRLRTK